MEYDKIKLNQDELRQVKFDIDSCKSRTLKLENSLKMVEYQRDHDIPTSTTNEKIMFLKETIKDCKTKIKELSEDDERYEDKVKKYEYDIFVAKISIKEHQMDLKLNLPNRGLNLDIANINRELDVCKNAMKSLTVQLRNGTKDVPAQRVQLDETQ